MVEPRIRLRGCATATLWACLCAVTAASCSEPAKPIADAPDAGRVAAPLPKTREAFLAELLPMPADTIVVVYDVAGPAGLVGTLEVLARPGGYRRDNWRLQLPVPDAGPVQIAGSTVQTPDERYRDSGPDGATVDTVVLGALADAYVEAAPNVRAAVVESIRNWHDALRVGRADHRGELDRIARVTCVQTRVVQSRLCLWEEAGLPLAYEGSVFSVRAKHVERDAQLGGNAFEIPQAAEARSDAAFDPRRTLEALAAGDVAALAVLTQPGLQLPHSEALSGT
jgi:hypothetical protein